MFIHIRNGNEQDTLCSKKGIVIFHLQRLHYPLICRCSVGAVTNLQHCWRTETCLFCSKTMHQPTHHARDTVKLLHRESETPEWVHQSWHIAGQNPADYRIRGRGARACLPNTNPCYADELQQRAACYEYAVHGGLNCQQCELDDTSDQWQKPEARCSNAEEL